MAAINTRKETRTGNVRAEMSVERDVPFWSWRLARLRK